MTSISLLPYRLICCDSCSVQCGRLACERFCAFLTTKIHGVEFWWSGLAQPFDKANALDGLMEEALKLQEKRRLPVRPPGDG